MYINLIILLCLTSLALSVNAQSCVLPALNKKIDLDSVPSRQIRDSLKKSLPSGVDSRPNAAGRFFEMEELRFAFPFAPATLPIIPASVYKWDADWTRPFKGTGIRF